MKRLIVVGFLCCCVISLNAQNFAIGLDKMNMFYLGMDNPITIAVENTKFSDIVVKTDNGIIKKNDLGKYVYIGESLGTATITLYKKVNNKLKKIGSLTYRVLRANPFPVFKIGSIAYYKKVKKKDLLYQNYVRAELENIEPKLRYRVDSFIVLIKKIDSCKSITVKNYTNKISEELHNAFEQLSSGDIILFKDIFVTGPGFLSEEIPPLNFTIE